MNVAWAGSPQTRDPRPGALASRLLQTGKDKIAGETPAPQEAVPARGGAGEEVRSSGSPAKWTKGKGPKILCVQVHRDDFNMQAEWMAADPEETRDLLGRHRTLVEGTVNNLKNHQGAGHAHWKGQAFAKLQLGLPVLLANAQKWDKVKAGHLSPVQLKPRAHAKKAS